MGVPVKHDNEKVMNDFDKKDAEALLKKLNGLVSEKDRLEAATQAVKAARRFGMEENKREITSMFALLQRWHSALATNGYFQEVYRDTLEHFDDWRKRFPEGP